MKAYVEPGEQLALELYVRNVKESAQFYRQFGFEIVREEPDFVELRWESAILMLEEVSDAPATQFPAGNVRVMVPNVDDYWALSQKLGVKVIREIGDRHYGLRDFTILGPDGIGLRFASWLADSSIPHDRT